MKTEEKNHKKQLTHDTLTIVFCNKQKNEKATLYIHPQKRVPNFIQTKYKTVTLSSFSKVPLT